MQDYENWDKSVGIVHLYSEKVIDTLLECYPVWNQQPERSDIEQLINCGCVFYQYDNTPYVISLGLKRKYEGVQCPKIEELDDLTGWFARFADLICRGNCTEEWYFNVIIGFKLSHCQYIKSFFTILSNMAYCIQKYEEMLEQLYNDESLKYITRAKVDELKSNYEELLVFEVTRDYKNELEQMQEMEQQIKKLIEKQQADIDKMQQKDVQCEQNKVNTEDQDIVEIGEMDSTNTLDNNDKQETTTQKQKMEGQCDSNDVIEQLEIPVENDLSMDYSNTGENNKNELQSSILATELSYLNELGADSVENTEEKKEQHTCNNIVLNHDSISDID